ncbi:MAG: hypothetical protein AAB368_06675, partial [bacterium]
MSACSGCAGGRTYPTGINHTYLCAVRSARAAGYQVRAQEFKAGGGKMIAARSTPDPKSTSIKRGWLKRTGEVVWNAWEHGSLEFWDEDVADARIRTEERLVAVFKADRGWFGWGRKRATRVSLKLDATDFGREDWVIRRSAQPADASERMYRSIGDCLGVVAPAVELVSATPSVVTAPPPSASPVETDAAPVSEPHQAVDHSEALSRGRKVYEAGDFAGAVAI